MISIEQNELKTHTQRIQKRLDSGVSVTEVTRHAYLGYQPAAVCSGMDSVLNIKDAVASEFGIRFSDVKVVGSAHIGESIHKQTKFNSKCSDLDIAVINTNIFLEFKESVHKLTNGYSFTDKFQRNLGKIKDPYKLYRNQLEKGFINPYLLPATIPLRKRWMSFFAELSKVHRNLFKSINGGVYESEYFFIAKQAELIQKLKSGVVIDD